MDWIPIIQALGITLPGFVALIWQIIKWRREKNLLESEVRKSDADTAAALVGGAKDVVNLYKQLEEPLKLRIKELEIEVRRLRKRVVVLEKELITLGCDPRDIKNGDEPQITPTIGS